MRLRIHIAALVICAASTALAADQVTIGTWNLESGDSDIDYLMAEVEDFDVRIWGLSEVNPDWEHLIEQHLTTAWSTDVGIVMGTTGRQDRLMIAYDTSAFELLESVELDSLSFSGMYRAPLVARLRLRASDARFTVVLVHFARTNEDRRNQQALGLLDWSAGESAPIVALGDFNFDWDPSSRRGNRSYELFTRAGLFDWVRPNPNVATHKSERFNSVLDFVFVTTPLEAWRATAHVEMRMTPAQDTPESSDHYPVIASVEIPSALTALGASESAGRVSDSIGSQIPRILEYPVTSDISVPLGGRLPTVEVRRLIPIIQVEALRLKDGARVASERDWPLVALRFDEAAAGFETIESILSNHPETTAVDLSILLISAMNRSTAARLAEREKALSSGSEWYQQLPVVLTALAGMIVALIGLPTAYFQYRKARQEVLRLKAEAPGGG